MVDQLFTVHFYRLFASFRFVSFRSIFCCFERIRIYSFVIQQFARLSAHDGAAPLSRAVCYGFVVSQLVIKPFAARLSAYTPFKRRPALISFLTLFAFISRSMNSRFTKRRDTWFDDSNGYIVFQPINLACVSRTVFCRKLASHLWRRSGNIVVNSAADFDYRLGNRATFAGN